MTSPVHFYEYEISAVEVKIYYYCWHGKLDVQPLEDSRSNFTLETLSEWRFSPLSDALSGRVSRPITPQHRGKQVY